MHWMCVTTVLSDKVMQNSMYFTRDAITAGLSEKLISVTLPRFTCLRFFSTFFFILHKFMCMFVFVLLFYPVIFSFWTRTYEIEAAIHDAVRNETTTMSGWFFLGNIYKKRLSDCNAHTWAIKTISMLMLMQCLHRHRTSPMWMTYNLFYYYYDYAVLQPFQCARE